MEDKTIAASDAEAPTDDVEERAVFWSLLRGSDEHAAREAVNGSSKNESKITDFRSCGHAPR
jgi:hypothetical protein